MGGTDGRKGLFIGVCRFSSVLSASLMIKVFSLSDVGERAPLQGNLCPASRQVGRRQRAHPGSVFLNAMYSNSPYARGLSWVPYSDPSHVDTLTYCQPGRERESEALSGQDACLHP